MKVLIFEGMKNLAEVWKDHCQQAGIESYTTDNVTGALELLKEHPDADYIFLESIFKEIMPNVLLTKAKIIATTGTSADRALIEAGAHCVLQKVEVHCLLQRGTNFGQVVKRRVEEEKTKQQQKNDENTNH